MTLFDVFNRALALQIKVCILECLNSFAFLFGLYFNRTFKIYSIDLSHSLQHLYSLKA
jgi:hypothetical protein